MSIPISQYVNITSGVGAGTNVANRDLYGRLFTGNVAIPPQTFVQFTNLAEVGSYFGTTTEEYYRAAFYFGWVSKGNQIPQAIQFARWVSAAVAPTVQPAQNVAPFVLATFTAVTAGGFIITINGVTLDLSGTLNFSAATDTADVASILQTGIRTGTGSLFTSATVVYHSTGANPGFVITSGVTGVTYGISIQPPISGTDITSITYLGWLPEQTISQQGAITNLGGAIWSNGSAAETTAQCLTTSASISNDFGSFLFLNNLNLSLAQVQAAANWNATTVPNNLFMYTVPLTPANVSSWIVAYPTGLGGVNGLSLTITSPTFTLVGTLTSSANTVTGLTSTAGLTVGMTISGTDIPTGTTIASITNSTSLVMSANATGSATVTITFYPLEFPEQAPMMIAAATDYSGFNTVQNYMFNIFNLTPSVTSQTTANSYNAQSINYYGQVQNAGVNFSFYQTGVLQGSSTSPLNQNAYMNEVWLKDAMAVAILNLLLGLTQVAANAQGRSQILSTMQGVINQALNNGTISVGKGLTTLQQTYVTQVTGDPTAWYQIQTNGYWVDVVISPSNTTPIVYTAVYTLLYSQDDVIRLVTGNNILI